MKNDSIKVNILSTKIIANASDDMLKNLGISPNYRSLGLVTCDCDDVLYTALDEATKEVDVQVVYGKSFYGGAGNASTKLAGEVIGIIAGPSPAEIKSGIASITNFINSGVSFKSANEDDSIVYYAQCVSRTGTFLSKQANIKEGESLAYLVAPPLESMYGLDAALKAADVRLCTLFEPPTETNFGGGLLTGSQSACKAACEAFAEAVIHVAENPFHI